LSQKYIRGVHLESKLATSSQAKTLSEKNCPRARYARRWWRRWQGTRLSSVCLANTGCRRGAAGRRCCASVVCTTVGVESACAHVTYKLQSSS
jgi:hypothetical protein